MLHFANTKNKTEEANIWGIKAGYKHFFNDNLFGDAAIGYGGYGDIRIPIISDILDIFGTSENIIQSNRNLILSLGTGYDIFVIKGFDLKVGLHLNYNLFINPSQRTSANFTSLGLAFSKGGSKRIRPFRI